MGSSKLQLSRAQRPWVGPWVGRDAAFQYGVGQAQIMSHSEGQHCGNGDVELEDAEDPCAYLSRVFQPHPLASHQILKEVCDRLEHLDPPWRLNPKELVSVLPTQLGPGESVVWAVVWRLGFTAEYGSKAKSKAIRILECVEDLLPTPY